MLKLGYIIIKVITNESEKSTSSFIGDFCPPSNSNNSSNQYRATSQCSIRDRMRMKRAFKRTNRHLGSQVSAVHKTWPSTAHNGIADYRANGDKYTPIWQ